MHSIYTFVNNLLYTYVIIDLTYYTHHHERIFFFKVAIYVFNCILSQNWLSHRQLFNPYYDGIFIALLTGHEWVGVISRVQ